jgi:uncharacterized membrane protein
MESRAKLLGHSIHQMMIPLPVGLLVMAVLFDVLTLTTDWNLSEVSFWNILAGIVTGLLAAVFGLIDWLAIPSGTRARRIGAVHGAGNVVLVLLFVAAALLRWNEPGFAVTTPAFVLELLGLALGGVTAWLGGELVARLGVGVDDGAHLNAPNSITHREAGEGAVVQPVAAPRSTR